MTCDVQVSAGVRPSAAGVALAGGEPVNGDAAADHVQVGRRVVHRRGAVGGVGTAAGPLPLHHVHAGQETVQLTDDRARILRGAREVGHNADDFDGIEAAHGFQERGHVRREEPLPVHPAVDLDVDAGVDPHPGQVWDHPCHLVTHDRELDAAPGHLLALIDAEKRAHDQDLPARTRHPGGRPLPRRSPRPPRPLPPRWPLGRIPASRARSRRLSRRPTDAFPLQLSLEKPGVLAHRVKVDGDEAAG